METTRRLFIFIARDSAHQAQKALQFVRKSAHRVILSYTDWLGTFVLNYLCFLEGKFRSNLHKLNARLVDPRVKPQQEKTTSKSRVQSPTFSFCVPTNVRKEQDASYCYPEAFYNRFTIFVSCLSRTL